MNKSHSSMMMSTDSTSESSHCDMPNMDQSCQLLDCAQACATSSIPLSSHNTVQANVIAKHRITSKLAYFYQIYPTVVTPPPNP